MGHRVRDPRFDDLELHLHLEGDLCLQAHSFGQY